MRVIRRTLCLGILGLALGSQSVAAITDPVRVEQGELAGSGGRSPDVRAYRGIPFAAPPVGDLRWREPRPVMPWDGVRDAVALLRAGRVELARGMVDNFFFEVEHYGAMLNANRTYYLTRSQPPFLSSMFVDVYDALEKSGHGDTA